MGLFRKQIGPKGLEFDSPALLQELYKRYMAQIYLATGKKQKLECRTEKEYITRCLELSKTYGRPFFEMCWPNKKIFTVYRDRQDNEIEVIFNPVTIASQ